MRDKNKVATFSGNVKVIQGDTTIKCQSLVVFYGGSVVAAPAVAAVTPPPRRQSAHVQQVVPQDAHDIRRIEARGGVTVITKDQTATGDLGVYDLKKKTITLTGNVVVSQGKNVMHGDRVIVDTTTGNAHVESRCHDASRTGSARSFSRAKTRMARRRTSCRSARTVPN